MVFSWHFLHGTDGMPVPFGYAPAVFPLALSDEGHIGVALFMTLSGYLFAKLLDGKDVQYGRFFWNRFVRLAPLLVFVMILYAALERLHFSAFRFDAYARDLGFGFLYPTWPNGGWSITVEMHFYVLLPVITVLMRRWPWAPLALIASAILLRGAVLHYHGTVRDAAYYTIVGRLDQFLLGILAFHSREFICGRHWQTVAISVLFLGFYWWFDRAGGFNSSALSASSIWVWLPTLQGLVFAWIVAYYDSSFRPSNGGVSQVIGRIGTYSYSIYLLHPFIVFRLPHFIDHRIIHLSNFYVSLAAGAICFCGMACVAWASFTFIEKPFLRLRVRYVRPTNSAFSELAAA